MSRGIEGWLEEVWYPTGRPGPASALLAPAGWLFGAAARGRNLAYDREWAEAVRLPIPVISVGNLAVGGAGKTPVVVEVARRLLASGQRPAILTRGYGGSGGRTGLVEAAHSGQDVGDEAVMCARRLPAALVLVGPDRVVSGRQAVAAGATVALLDDGFQHRRLHRDLDIVVVDGARGLGNGRHLPAGPLREGPAAFERASLVWITRVDEGEGGWRPPPGLPVVRSRYQPEGVLRPDGGLLPPEALAGRAVLPLAGIARPASFLHTLTALGARVAAPRLYPDHHPFSPDEVAGAAEAAQALGALLVTTEKDAARLPPGGPPVHVLVVRAEILEGGPHLSSALARVCDRIPA